MEEDALRGHEFGVASYVQSCLFHPFIRNLQEMAPCPKSPAHGSGSGRFLYHIARIYSESFHSNGGSELCLV